MYMNVLPNKYACNEKDAVAQLACGRHGGRLGARELETIGGA